MVMELLSGGELFNSHRGRTGLRCTAARSLRADPVHVGAVHSLSIVHRDVGRARGRQPDQAACRPRAWAPRGAPRSRTGATSTLAYAVEVLTRYDDDEHGTLCHWQGRATCRSLLLYVILSQVLQMGTRRTRLSLVAQAKYEFLEAEWSTNSPGARLAAWRLVVDPEQRMTMQQALEHAWLKEAVGARGRRRRRRARRRCPRARARC